MKRSKFSEEQIARPASRSDARASIVLYVGLGIVIAATPWNHWKSAHP